MRSGNVPDMRNNANLLLLSWLLVKGWHAQKIQKKGIQLAIPINDRFGFHISLKSFGSINFCVKKLRIIKKLQKINGKFHLSLKKLDFLYFKMLPIINDVIKNMPEITMDEHKKNIPTKNDFSPNL